EGMYEYLRLSWEKSLPAYDETPIDLSARRVDSAPTNDRTPAIDRSPKLYIGGKQARPDSGYSYTVTNQKGKAIGEAGLGNRKDIRNAVEAAAKASSWSRSTAHLRAQILFYIAENLSARSAEFESRLHGLTGASKSEAAREVTMTVERLFYYAAWADKNDGHVHHTPFRNVTLAM